jgi:hypothetical protein
MTGDPSPSEADLRLTRRLNEAARILQIQMLDHVIIGEPRQAGIFQLQGGRNDWLKSPSNPTAAVKTPEIILPRHRSPPSSKQPGSIYRLPGRSGIAQRTLFAPLKKELLELLVSLAADLFDFEVAPWSTSLFGRLGDNCRYRFTSRDWFFCRIAFDIRAIESIEIRLWMQRRISVHTNTR